MSKNFVLVQFGNQTRKIAGDPQRKKFNTLVRQIQDKFDIDADIDIQVFDRDNNQYYYIDSSERNEIRNGGKIKVTRAKGSGKGTKKPSPKKGSPMKPPGVPPPTKEDDAKRSAWRKGSRVEIYSESERKWIDGEIVRVYNDREGEWLVIRYAAARTKEIQRFSNYIRPVQPARKKRERKPRETNKGDKKREERTEKKEKKEPRKPKVVKVTTQSKYKRKRREPLPEGPENVVEFRGNSQRIKQYIDRACLLLRGPKEMPEEEVKAEVDEDDEKKEKKAPFPTQKWDVVHLHGTGRAMGSVVSAAEIIKRIVPGLHQMTETMVNTAVDVYEPTEVGLKNVEVERNVSGIRVTLAVHQKDVDTSSAGYQEPEQYEDGFGKIEYQYPDEKRQRKKRKPRRNPKGQEATK